MRSRYIVDITSCYKLFGVTRPVGAEDTPKGYFVLSMKPTFLAFVGIFYVTGLLQPAFCQRSSNGTVNCTLNKNSTDSNSCTAKLLDAFKSGANGSETPCQWCYWNWNLTFHNVSEITCESDWTVNYVFSAASYRDVAEFKLDNEQQHMRTKSILQEISVSNISSCYESGYANEGCVLTPRMSDFSEASAWVRVKFRQKDLDDQRAAVAAVGTASNKKRVRIMNFASNIGNEFRFGWNAPIVFAVVHGRNESTPQVTIEIEQVHPIEYIDSSIRILNVTPVCAFFNTTFDAWDSSVCTTKEISAERIECSCHHNSAFAVIFALKTIEVDSIVTHISMVCEIVSVIACFVTVVVLILYRRKMRNFDRVLVQINLCTSLAMAHVFLMLSGVAHASKNLLFCQAIIVASHFFLMTSAVFMVMEGALMLMKVLIPNFGGSLHTKRRRVLGFVIGWILPAVYVAVCAVIGFYDGSYGNYDGYTGRYDVCWIVGHMNLVVIVPISVALLINIFILIRLAAVVTNLSRRAEEFKPSNERDHNSLTHAGTALKAVAILSPILGIPFILGYLINTGPPTDAVFASIHVIVNGCQGIFIFLHYVVFNSDMKSNIKRSWNVVKSDVVILQPIAYFTNSNQTDSTSDLKFE